MHASRRPVSGQQRRVRHHAVNADSDTMFNLLTGPRLLERVAARRRRGVAGAGSAGAGSGAGSGLTLPTEYSRSMLAAGGQDEGKRAMARPLRLEFAGAVYHVTARGNERRSIFLGDGDEDRVAFLDILGRTCERFNWICHAFCLMTNHYHLLVETPDANLSKGMRQLNGVYTQHVNRSRGRVGHLFQGRFKGILQPRGRLCRPHDRRRRPPGAGPARPDQGPGETPPSPQAVSQIARRIVLSPVRAGLLRDPRRSAPWNGVAIGRVWPSTWARPTSITAPFNSRPTGAAPSPILAPRRR